MSVAISAAFYALTDSLFVFLFLPFVPVLLGRSHDELEPRRCPACGFETTDESFDYCPRDGTALD